MMLAGFWADWGFVIAFGSIVIIYCVIVRRKDSKTEPSFMRLLRRCLPELDLFPSTAARGTAFGLASNNWQNYAVMVAMGIVGLATVLFVLPILYSVFPIPWQARPFISAVPLAGFPYSYIWLTRARIRRRLREILILEGFPICGPCGYDLRGLTEPRCPECGAPFDKKLLTESPPQTEDSGQQDNSER